MAGPRALFRLAAVGALAVLLALAAPARVVAQSRAAGPASGASAQEVNLNRVIAGLFELGGTGLRRGQEQIFRFLETIELFDLEGELDRYAGDPRTFNDSTSYKLSLLPFHIQYPIYQQLIRQMTRHDELGSRRVYNVTPEGVDVIALDLASLTDEDHSDEIRRSLLSFFSAREIVDLTFYGLAQQPFFPETHAGWAVLRHRIAGAGPGLLAGALVAGAAFDAGAFTQSGALVRGADRERRLGWFAGFRHLGFSGKPQLRAGFTSALPGLAASLGVTEQVRPGESQRGRSIEAAAREGWLNRLVAPSGWDAFIETALRRVVNEGPLYGGEGTTGRVGLFAKRDELKLIKNVAMRASVEAETNFFEHMRFAVGAGFEHTPSNLIVMAQASRTAVVTDGGELPHTQGGVFLVGSMEPLTKRFVDDLASHGRVLADEWARAARGDETPGARAVPLAEALADYLEARRTAYSVMRWRGVLDDLHGPADAAVVRAIAAETFARLRASGAELARVVPRLRALHRVLSLSRESMAALQNRPDEADALAAWAGQLAAEERTLAAESRRWRERLDEYRRLREAARRVQAASPPTRVGAADPLPPKVESDLETLLLYEL